jgi:hypothetical protein
MSSCNTTINCRDLLPNQDRYYKNFADAVYTEFRRLRYGIKSCKKDLTALQLDIMRKEILDWQKLEADCTVNVATQDISIVAAPTVSVDLNLDSSNGTIYVNMGGCNVAINVVTKSDNYTHSQSVPSATWVIVHNLGYNPVVRTEDSLGGDMEGVITHDTLNQLTILFSEPVSGTAYLS